MTSLAAPRCEDVFRVGHHSSSSCFPFFRSSFQFLYDVALARCSLARCSDNVFDGCKAMPEKLLWIVVMSLLNFIKISSGLMLNICCIINSTVK
jgi:hypothetical protein